MSDPFETRLLQARVQLLMQQPLIGQMILHLEMQDASDWCPTAATDGRKFFYNRKYIEGLTFDELIFVHAHETLHTIFQHMFRRGERDKIIWNMAIDFICNYILKKSKIGKMPVGCLYNENYTDEFSAEELYDLLIRQAVKIQQPMDMHLDALGDGSAAPQEDGNSGPPKMTAAEAEEVQENLRTALVQAAQNTDPGKVPAGIGRLLNQLLKPKINWRQMLAITLRSAIRYDFTFTRLSRRSWSSGLILPGQNVTEKVSAAAMLDGSASTTQEMITDFLSECRGIMQTFRDYELTVMTFDTEVCGVKTFTPYNMNEIDSYEFNGGGGTRPSCCWDYMKEHKLKPDKLLMFTDGEVGNDWGDETYADTLFIVHSNPHLVAPYGRTCAYART